MGVSRAGIFAEGAWSCLSAACPDRTADGPAVRLADAKLRRDPRQYSGLFAALFRTFRAPERASSRYPAAFMIRTATQRPARKAMGDATLGGDSHLHTTIGGRNLPLEFVLATVPIGGGGPKRRSWREATRLGAASSIGDSTRNASNWKSWKQWHRLGVVEAAVPIGARGEKPRAAAWILIILFGSSWSKRQPRWSSISPRRRWCLSCPTRECCRHLLARRHLGILNLKWRSRLAVYFESQAEVSNRQPIKKNWKFSGFLTPAVPLACGGGGERRGFGGLTSFQGMSAFLDASEKRNDSTGREGAGQTPWNSDPAPRIQNGQPECHRRVRYIRFVGVIISRPQCSRGASSGTKHAPGRLRPAHSPKSDCRHYHTNCPPTQNNDFLEPRGFLCSRPSSVRLVLKRSESPQPHW